MAAVGALYARNGAFRSGTGRSAWNEMQRWRAKQSAMISDFTDQSSFLASSLSDSMLSATVASARMSGARAKSVAKAAAAASAAIDKIA